MPHYINLQNATFSLKAIHFFDKIKLILDDSGLTEQKNQADIITYYITFDFFLDSWSVQDRLCK